MPAWQGWVPYGCRTAAVRLPLRHKGQPANRKEGRSGSVFFSLIERVQDEDEKLLGAAVAADALVVPVAS